MQQRRNRVDKREKDTEVEGWPDCDYEVSYIWQVPQQDTLPYGALGHATATHRSVGSLVHCGACVQ
jgi:hypothetical protein